MLARRSSSLRKGNALQQLFSTLTGFFQGSLGILVLYLVVLNLLCFVLMALDRVRAREHVFRTPQSVFLVLSLMGGSIGNFLGLLFFRLRARSLTLNFLPGIVLIPILQLAAILVICAAAGQIRFL